MAEADFWDLTLRELDALMQRHAQAVERDDARIAVSIAMVRADLANMFRDGKSKPVKATDLLPARFGGAMKERKAQPAQEQSWQDMKQMAMFANATFGGKVVSSDGSDQS